MSNLSVKSVTNRHGFVVTLEETGKGHIKVWGNGVTLAQEQTIELRDWLNERYPTQPAAGEPDQQTAINADDLPTKKYPLGAFDFAAPVAAGEPVAPGVNYAEEVDLIRAVLEGYSPSIARSDALCSVKLLKSYFAAPPAAAHRDSFRTWLAAEMPAGTVIGNPAWWAERILKRIGAAAHGDEAVRLKLPEFIRCSEEMHERGKSAVERAIEDQCFGRWTQFKVYFEAAIEEWLSQQEDAAMRAQAGDKEVL